MNKSSDDHPPPDRQAAAPETEQPAETQVEQQPPATGEPPVENVSPEEMARFITTIKNPEQQVGEHVVAALQHADTVAVLTTVVVGPTGQRHIVSAALNPQQTALINALLQQSAAEREVEEPCIGFHCLIKPKSQFPPGQAPE